jgi:hypothetical protein
MADDTMVSPEDVPIDLPIPDQKREKVTDIPERLKRAKTIQKFREQGKSDEEIAASYERVAAKKGWPEKTYQEFKQKSIVPGIHYMDTLSYGFTDIGKSLTPYDRKEYESILEITETLDPGSARGASAAGAAMSPLNFVPLARPFQSLRGGKQVAATAAGSAGLFGGSNLLSEIGAADRKTNPEAINWGEVGRTAGLAGAIPLAAGTGMGLLGAISRFGKKLKTGQRPTTPGEEAMMGQRFGGADPSKGSVADQFPAAADEQIGLIARSYQNIPQMVDDFSKLMSRSSKAKTAMMDDYNLSLEQATGTGNFSFNKNMRDLVENVPEARRAFDRFAELTGKQYYKIKKVPKRDASGNVVTKEVGPRTPIKEKYTTWRNMTDSKGQPLKYKNGPNKGKVRKEKVTKWRNKTDAQGNTVYQPRKTEQVMEDKLIFDKKIPVKDYDHIRRLAAASDDEVTRAGSEALSGRFQKAANNEGYSRGIAEYGPKLDEVNRLEAQEQLYQRSLDEGQRNIAGRGLVEEKGKVNLPGLRGITVQGAAPQNTRGIITRQTPKGGYEAPLSGDMPTLTGMLTDPNAITAGVNRLRKDQTIGDLLAGLGVLGGRIGDVD